MAKIRAVPYDGDIEQLERRRPEMIYDEPEDKAPQPITDRSSPFDQVDDHNDGGPKQELSILAFPVQTLKLISDEAAKRGMTFADATSEAFMDWMKKDELKQNVGEGLPGLPAKNLDPPAPKPKGRYVIGGTKRSE